MTSRADGPTYRGRVKFFKADKGWGGIESDEAPGDVWIHFSNIEAPPGQYRSFEDGQLVEFQYESARQDSWNYRATWARAIDDSG